MKILLALPLISLGEALLENKDSQLFYTWCSTGKAVTWDFWKTCLVNECTLKSSYVVSDVLWCFLHWSLGLNKHSGKHSPALVWKAPQGSPALCGGCAKSLVSSTELAAPGSTSLQARLGLHRDFRPFVSWVLLGCHSFCLHYTVKQETFFPHHT